MPLRTDAGETPAFAERAVPKPSAALFNRTGFARADQSRSVKRPGSARRLPRASGEGRREGFPGLR